MVSPSPPRPSQAAEPAPFPVPCVPCRHASSSYFSHRHYCVWIFRHIGTVVTHGWTRRHMAADLIPLSIFLLVLSITSRRATAWRLCVLLRTMPIPTNGMSRQAMAATVMSLIPMVHQARCRSHRQMTRCSTQDQGQQTYGARTNHVLASTAPSSTMRCLQSGLLKSSTLTRRQRHSICT